MRKTFLVAGLMVASLALAAPANAATSCADKANAFGLGVGGAISAVGVLTVGGIFPGIIIGKATHDNVEKACREAALRGSKPSGAAKPWRNPDTGKYQ